MRESILTQPPTEAIGLTEAKTYLRVTHNEEDIKIQHLIRSARSFCEEAGRISILRKRYKVVYALPYMLYDSVTSFAKLADPDRISEGIRLGRKPVRDIVSVSEIVRGQESAWTEGTDYTWTEGTRDILFHRPILATDTTTQLQVVYDAGYDPVELPTNYVPVPSDLRQAILELTAHMYDNPGQGAVLTFGIKQLLAPYWHPFT